MSPRMRGIRASDAIKAFERAGGVRRSGKGDHVNIKMPNGMIITLRARGEIGIGLLRDLLAKARMTRQEFERYLKP